LSLAGLVSDASSSVDQPQQCYVIVTCIKLKDNDKDQGASNTIDAKKAFGIHAKEGVTNPKTIEGVEKCWVCKIVETREITFNNGQTVTSVHTTEINSDGRVMSENLR
jgi:hypothetical protein